MENARYFLHFWRFLHFDQNQGVIFIYISYEIAERIKNLAINKKIDLKDILKECGLGKNAITHLYDNHMIKADSLAKIADVLECSIDYLMGRTNVIEINKGE